MALATELIGVGIAPVTASAIGGTSGSIAAAGSAQGDGTLVKASVLIATGADGTKGITLPAGAVGDEVWVFNNSASTLKVYPPAGAAVAVTGTGTGTANAAHSLLTFKVGVYKCQSSTQWFVVIT